MPRARRTPLYQQIADDLREQVEDGRLPAGAQIPTQEQLVAEWRDRLPGCKVSRGTIRRAMEDLVNEGLVLSRRPLGVFVRDRQRITIRPQDEFGRRFSTLTDWFMGVIAEQGGAPSQEITTSIVHPPKVVADRLRTGTDDVVLVRMRVRSVNGERHDLNDSYYPMEVVAGSEAMRPDDIARGVNALLDELGAYQVLLLDEYVARMPTVEESRRLDLSPGTPMLEQIVTGYLGDTPDSEPVRCVVTVYRGDCTRILYERRRPAAERVRPEPGE